MVVNATINATAESSLQGFAYFKEVFVPDALQRFVDLVTAPAKVPEMIWIVVPLVVSLLVMTIYFGRYAKEELGWNTAVGNTLVLIFVSVDLLRHLYNNPHIESSIDAGGFAVPIKTVVALLLLFEGFMLLYSSFFHWMPKKIAFFITSSLPVNLTAYVAIAIVYSNIPFDWITIAAAVILFVLLFIFFKLFKFMEGNIFGVKKKKDKPAELKE